MKREKNSLSEIIIHTIHGWDRIWIQTASSSETLPAKKNNDKIKSIFSRAIFFYLSIDEVGCQFFCLFVNALSKNKVRRRERKER